MSEFSWGEIRKFINTLLIAFKRVSIVILYGFQVSLKYHSAIGLLATSVSLLIL